MGESEQSDNSSGEKENDSAGSKPRWKIGDTVLVTWHDEQQYEGGVIDVGQCEGEPTYRIHYQGWGKRYDETVNEKLMVEASEENKRKAKESLDRAKQLESSKKRKSRASTSSAKTEEESERKGPVERSTYGGGKGSVKRSIGEASQNGTTDTPVSKKNMSGGRKMAKYDESGAKQELNFEPLTLPSKLKVVLEKDRVYTTDDDWLPHIPAEFTVSKIIELYCKTMDASSYEEKKGFAQKLTDCFKPDIFSSLLYSFEKPMFEGMCAGKSGYYGFRKDKDRMASESANINELTELFGLPYLLRLLSSFHELQEAIAEEGWNQEDVNKFITNCEALMGFLEEHVDEYFEGPDGYYPAIVGYCNDFYDGK